MPYQCVESGKFSTGKRRMHKPEEPLPFPFHVRIFVIIPISAAAFSLSRRRPKTPATEKATAPGIERESSKKRVPNILAFNQEFVDI